MQLRPALTSPRVSTQARATTTLLLRRQPGSAAVWECSFCGCARNTTSDAHCKLCKRAPGRGRSALRSSLAHVHASADESDAVEENSLEAIEARAAAHSKAAAIRRVLNAGTEPECAICYEVTMEGTYCCGQPLCCGCAASLSTSDCPCCRQKLQHRRAPKHRPTPSSKRPEEELEARGGGIDLVGLLHNAASVMVSQPPEDKDGDKLPQLTHLRQQSNLELPNYVDYVVGYAGSLRNSGSSSAYVMESRLRLLIEDIFPVLDRHLQKIETSHSGRAVAIRQFERLKRHGLLKPAHLERMEALCNN